MLVAAVEHTALKAVSESSGRSPLPLNVEHEAVMAEVLEGVVETTELLNFLSPIE
jgi:RIO-like serine/threonine protein kinase